MILLFLPSALAGDPEIQDEGDAWYLEQTGRTEAAARWYAERIDAEPHSARFLSAYLRTIGTLPQQRSLALVLQVQQWKERHPDAADAGVALARAHYYAELEPSIWSSLFARAGSWCAPATEALAALPEEGPARYRVLRERVRVGRRCGGPFEEDEAALEALARSGEAGPLYRALHLGDEIDQDEVTALKEGLAQAPWLLVSLARYASPETTGEGAEEARALLLERARAYGQEDRPSRVWAAIAVLQRAGQTEEAQALRERLQDLDPDNEFNARALEQPPEEEGEDETAPHTLLEPSARLKALLEQGPGGLDSRWEKLEYWSALASAAEGAGDVQTELRALDRLWHLHWSADPNVRFAEACVEAGQQLRRAARAARIAVNHLRDPKGFPYPADEQAQRRWREDLARALDARAKVASARGRHARARDDLEEALALAGPVPDRMFRLGWTYFALDKPASGAPLLGGGLLSLPEDDPRRQEAKAQLAEHLQSLPGWQPDVETWLAALQARIAPAAPAAPTPTKTLDGSRFADLSLPLGGQERRLLDIEGPIVLDVWATWCGPCKASLPELETLAQKYAGRVTFIAASVDDDPAKPERYFAQHGAPSFLQGFLGKDGMSRVGVDGIPAIFVFDAEHRLVDQLSGYSPGSTRLDDAVRAMLGEP